jgi:UDP-N-acetylmuramoyl-tripeptide--D-alanyl-D-alanine ligase
VITLVDILESLVNKNTNNGINSSAVYEGCTSLVVSEAVIDSRQVIPAAMFVALPGERTDGHLFVSDAFQRGAIVALIQSDLAESFPVIDLRNNKITGNFFIPNPPFCIRVENTLQALQTVARFWRRKLNVQVVGITGSVGKSMTKELISGVLGQRYRTLKSPGNLNNEIGLPLTLLRLGPGHQRAVVEMGFYVPGEITFLCDLALPQIGVITNIGTVHAERAGSQEAIAAGKAELVAALPPAPQGTAVLNYDDILVRQMADKTRANVFYYGLDPSSDLWADQIVGQGLEGIQFRMHFHNEVIHLHIPLIGRHSVHTALRAAAVGLIEGLSWQDIVTGLQRTPTQLRLAAVYSKTGALLLDDTYNASPESMLAALNLLIEIEGHKIAVLGDMLELGPYEQQGHDMVGFRAAEVCEKLFTVGVRGKLISEAAHRAGMKTSHITWYPTVEETILHLQGYLKEGDVVLVKGSHSLRMDRIVAALEVGS